MYGGYTFLKERLTTSKKANFSHSRTILVRTMKKIEIRSYMLTSWRIKLKTIQIKNKGFYFYRKCIYVFSNQRIHYQGIVQQLRWNKANLTRNNPNLYLIDNLISRRMNVPRIIFRMMYSNQIMIIFSFLPWHIRIFLVSVNDKRNHSYETSWENM